MALKKEPDSEQDRCKLTIDEDLTIYTIESLKQDIGEEIPLHKKFALDLSDIEEIDSAGVQLLLALKNELMQQQKELVLSAISGPVDKLLTSYGIKEQFNRGDTV